METLRHPPDTRRCAVALAGNPNVGKSTVFNALTGMRQHTGNWPGKTVAVARGACRASRHALEIIDTPGTYSLIAHSAEEESARNFICFGAPDAAIVVCDATCLERNLNLALQTMEVCPRVLICVNLMDEAHKRGIHVDLDALSRALGAPVVGTAARSRSTLAPLVDALDALLDAPARECKRVPYPAPLEAALAGLEPALRAAVGGRLSARWLALRLLENDGALLGEAQAYLGADVRALPEVRAALIRARAALDAAGLAGDKLRDAIVSGLTGEAGLVCARAAVPTGQGYGPRDRRLDGLLTSRRTGYPIMLMMLAAVFYITISGANYPSELLMSAFGRVEEAMRAALIALGAPAWLRGALVEGIWRVLSWVVAVMLPPMAIFFPLFALLEDSGYLPRVAYMLDRPLKRCRACGKQCLTMCMGLGCNAAGVVGCRIIDSPRERLIAILTNSLMPCNGRFPTLILLIGTFFTVLPGPLGSVWAAICLTLLIALSVAATLAASALLSRTLLKGLPSSFVLELPPYRRPQFAQAIARALMDRIVFVLGRAAAVAAPAGLFIWLMANVAPGGVSLMSRMAGALDPLARLMGLDGVILSAFILGFPANEIVLPLAVMAYLEQGSVSALSGVEAVRELLTANGWTWLTALNTMLFSLMHWPCSTTLLTIRRETGSLRWTAAALALPTLMGMAVCMLTTLLMGPFAR